MHTILYVGSTTDLTYERELIAEWGKRDVTIATCASLENDLAATGTDGTAPEAPDPLVGVSVVVLESGTMDAEKLLAHPYLSAVVILDDENAEVDVEAATKAEIWVTRAANRAIISRLPFVSRQEPLRSTRRHALQDALACIAGERPSGRINEL